MIDAQAQQIIRDNPTLDAGAILALIAALPPIAKSSSIDSTYITYLSIGAMFGNNVAGDFRDKLPSWGVPQDLSSLNPSLPNPGALKALHARLDGYPGVDMSSPDAPALLSLFATGIPQIGLAPLLTADQSKALLTIGYTLPTVPSADDVEAAKRQIKGDATALSLRQQAADRYNAFIALIETWQAGGATGDAPPIGSL